MHLKLKKTCWICTGILVLIIKENARSRNLLYWKDKILERFCAECQKTANRGWLLFARCLKCQLSLQIFSNISACSAYSVVPWQGGIFVCMIDCDILGIFFNRKGLWGSSLIFPLSRVVLYNFIDFGNFLRISSSLLCYKNFPNYRLKLMISFVLPSKVDCKWIMMSLRNLQFDHLKTFVNSARTMYIFE